MISQSNRSRSLSAALWVNAALLAVIAFSLAFHSSESQFPEFLPAAYAQPAGPQQPIAGGAGLFLMPAQFSSNTWGCYVMDVDSQKPGIM